MAAPGAGAELLEPLSRHTGAIALRDRTGSLSAPMIEASLQMHQALLGRSEFLPIFANDMVRCAVALVMAKTVPGALDRLPGLLEFMAAMLDPQHVGTIDALGGRRRCCQCDER